MKLLHVSGNGDFGWVEFEQDYPNPKDVLYKLDLLDHFDSPETEDDEGYSVQLYEFSAVDPRFVEFIRENFIEYDFSTAENFYVIED